ncbi:hypothetical protein D3C87_1958920 [compost metagenome]
MLSSVITGVSSLSLIVPSPCALTIVALTGLVRFTKKDSDVSSISSSKIDTVKVWVVLAEPAGNVMVPEVSV